MNSLCLSFSFMGYHTQKYKKVANQPCVCVHIYILLVVSKSLCGYVRLYLIYIYFYIYIYIYILLTHALSNSINLAEEI